MLVVGAPADQQRDDGQHDQGERRLHQVGEVRPVSTAPRAMGSERKRSMRPLCMSSAMPAPAPAVAKVTVCAKMPAIRNSR